MLSDKEGFVEDTTRNYWVLSKLMAKSFSRGELHLRDWNAKREETIEDSAQIYTALSKDVADSFSRGEGSNLQDSGANKVCIFLSIIPPF